MKPKFQFRLSDLIIATMWAAVFCANWVLARRSESYRSLLDGYLFASLIYIPPSAIVGALFGRHLLGILCGLAGMIALYFWTKLDPIYTLSGVDFLCSLTT